MTISPKVQASFPDLCVLVSLFENVVVRKSAPELEAFKERIIQETRHSYETQSLKDEPLFRAYRDFFWRIKVDPTKTRPAAEALIRRVVSGKPLPCINTLVDAFNLASVKTGIAIAAFDTGKTRAELTMRYAEKDERFHGIGMKKPLLLQGGEIVIQDEDKLVAVYPYRDAEASKVTVNTKNCLLLFCGVPRIGLRKLSDAQTTTTNFVTRFCGGNVEIQRLRKD